MKCKYVIPIVTDWQVYVRPPKCKYRGRKGECTNPNRHTENGSCPLDRYMACKGVVVTNGS